MLVIEFGHPSFGERQGHLQRDRMAAVVTVLADARRDIFVVPQIILVRHFDFGRVCQDWNRHIDPAGKIMAEILELWTLCILLFQAVTQQRVGPVLHEEQIIVEPERVLVGVPIGLSEKVLGLEVVI